MNPQTSNNTNLISLLDEAKLSYELPPREKEELMQEIISNVRKTYQLSQYVDEKFFDQLMDYESTGVVHAPHELVSPKFQCCTQMAHKTLRNYKIGELIRNRDGLGVAYSQEEIWKN